MNIQQLVREKNTLKGMIPLFYRSMRSVNLKLSIQFFTNNQDVIGDNYATFGQQEKVIQFLSPEKYPIRKKVKDKSNNTPTFSEKSDNCDQDKCDDNMIIQQGEDIIEMSLEQINEMVQDPQTSIETLIQLLSIQKAEIVYNVCSRIKQVLLVTHVQNKLQTQGIEQFKKLLSEYNTNYLVIQQLLFILCRINSIKLNIYDDDLIAIIVNTLKNSQDLIVQSIILDILKINLVKESQSNLKKLFKFNILEILQQLMICPYKDQQIIGGALKLLFDLITLQQKQIMQGLLQFNIISEIKVTIMKYYYHHEIVKNGIKILQYLLAQQNDKLLIIKPEDIDIFEKISEHYQTDNIITKFQAAILKDLSYESSFSERNGVKVLLLLTKMILVNKNLRETINQAIISLYRLSEQEKNHLFFKENADVFKRIEDFFIIFQSNENIILITLKIINNLYSNNEIYEYVQNNTDINERIDYIYERIYKKQNKGIMLGKGEVEILKVLQAIVQQQK